jgi:AraC-like DNA-binding protein
LDEVAPILDLARLHGVAEPPALQGLVDLADVFRVLKRLAQASGEETFALSTRPMVAGTAEFVVSQARGCATLGEAMRAIARAYNVLHGAEYNRVERQGGRLRYAIYDDAYPYTRPRDGVLHFSLECATIFLHAVLSELARRDLGNWVLRVETRRPPAARPSGGALDLWSAPVRGAAEVYAITYDAAIADLPLQAPRAGESALPPDLAVHNRILTLIEDARRATPPGPKVAEAVRRALASGLEEQDEVARRLSMSPATLRRRLAEEGEQFRTLRQAAMRDYACVRLAQTADVSRVSDELGFSDPRAFTRAFKGWTGATPSAWRRGAVSETVP